MRKKLIKILTIIIVIIILMFVIKHNFFTDEGLSLSESWSKFLEGFPLVGDFLKDHAFAVASIMVGGLILCFVIDKDAATEAVEEIGSSVGAMVGGVAGGAAAALTSSLTTAASSSGILGLVLLVGGAFLLYKWLSGRSNPETIQAEVARINARTQLIEARSNYNNAVSDSKDSIPVNGGI